MSRNSHVSRQKQERRRNRRSVEGSRQPSPQLRTPSQERLCRGTKPTTRITALTSPVETKAGDGDPSTVASPSSTDKSDLNSFASSHASTASSTGSAATASTSDQRQPPARQAPGFHVRDQDKLLVFLNFKLGKLIQAALKKLCERLIDALCPNKRARNPHAKDEYPPYWPVEVARYSKGAHHVKKNELVPLVIILTRLDWTLDDFKKHNDNLGDPQMLEHGWSAFVENVMDWSTVRGKFSKRPERNASQRKCLQDVLSALRAERDFLDGRTDGTAWFELAPRVSLEKPKVMKEYPHYFERRPSERVRLRKQLPFIRPTPVPRFKSQLEHGIQGEVKTRTLSSNTENSAPAPGQSLVANAQETLPYDAHDSLKYEVLSGTDNHDTVLSPPQQLQTSGGQDIESLTFARSDPSMTSGWTCQPQNISQAIETTPDLRRSGTVACDWTAYPPGLSQRPTGAGNGLIDAHPPMVLDHTVCQGLHPPVAVYPASTAPMTMAPPSMTLPLHYGRSASSDLAETQMTFASGQSSMQGIMTGQVPLEHPNYPTVLSDSQPYCPRLDDHMSDSVLHQLSPDSLFRTSILPSDEYCQPWQSTQALYQPMCGYGTLASPYSYPSHLRSMYGAQ